MEAEVIVRRSYIIVPGTGSMCSDPSPIPHKDHWWEPGAPLYRYLAAFELLPVKEPFEWSGDLDGAWGWLPWNWFGSSDHRDWRAAGSGFRYYLEGIDYNNRNVIVHSHGLQVVAYAMAAYGWRPAEKIRRLITVGSPIRKDMADIIKLARPNIGKWIHVFDPTWKDFTQVAGEFGDRQVDLNGERIAALADQNISIPGIGHSEILRKPTQFHHLREQGLVEFLKS